MEILCSVFQTAVTSQLSSKKSRQLTLRYRFEKGIEEVRTSLPAVDQSAFSLCFLLNRPKRPTFLVQYDHISQRPRLSFHLNAIMEELFKGRRVEHIVRHRYRVINVKLLDSLARGSRVGTGSSSGLRWVREKSEGRDEQRGSAQSHTWKLREDAPLCLQVSPCGSSAKRCKVRYGVEGG